MPFKLPSKFRAPNGETYSDCKYQKNTFNKVSKHINEYFISDKMAEESYWENIRTLAIKFMENSDNNVLIREVIKSRLREDDVKNMLLKKDTIQHILPEIIKVRYYSQTLQHHQLLRKT